MHGLLRITACVAAFMAAVLPCLAVGAGQAGPLSPSVVLVLKLVAADRVQPVTGVVVSDDGLVLVPADFVAEPAELVVLDGGTDILGNGRPAQLFKQLPEAGLALLSVAGLERPAIALSAPAGDPGSQYLHAFPPARQIASGAEPLQLELSTGTALPYVTGAILDACGSLSGLAVAAGKQSLDSGQQPVVIDGRALAGAFEEFQVSVPRAACRILLERVADSADEDPVVVADPELVEPAVETPTAATEQDGPAGASGAGPDAVEQPPLTVAEPEPVSIPAPAKPPASRVIPWWLQLAGLGVLAALARGIFLNFRKHAREQAANPSASLVQPASDEPDTMQLAGTARAPAAVPRSGRDGDAELPGLDELPAGCDGLVLLEGDLGTGGRSRYFCAVDMQRFDLVIGRGDADIRIEHAAISRRHALLKGRGEVMTLADLGSSNGTFIDRVPCLPGEVMHVEPGSEIRFGDACLSVALVKRREAS